MSLPLGLGCLVEKRAELTGEIRQLEDRLEQLRSDVLHVDAVIRLMDPAFQPDAIVPKKRRQGRNWFGNGELLRSVLETLRKAPEPMTAKEVALAIMEQRGFDVNDGGTLRLVEKRVFATVLRREGSLVEKVVYGPRAVGWRIAG
jgi:hypothetical protein